MKKLDDMMPRTSTASAASAKTHFLERVAKKRSAIDVENKSSAPQEIEPSKPPCTEPST
jgi:hypothetical protein